MIWKYFFTAVGGFLAIFTHFFLVFRSVDLLEPRRWGMSIAAALMFAHLLALMVWLARDLPASKRDEWRFMLRLLVAVGGGFVLGTAAWWSLSTLVLYIIPPPWPVLFLGGVGLALGFVVEGLFPARRLSILLVQMGITVMTIFVPIYVTFQQFLINQSNALLYFQRDNPDHVFLIGIPLTLMMVVFSYAPLMWGLLHRNAHGLQH